MPASIVPADKSKAVRDALRAALARPVKLPDLPPGLDKFSEIWYDDEAELRRDNMTFGNISKRFYFEEIAVKPRR